MSKKINIQEAFQPLLLYLAVSVIFFWKIIFFHHVVFMGDTLLQRLPSMVYWKERVVQDNQIPLWNPYIFAGIPFLADLANNTLSPFNLIYLIFSDSLTALSFLIVLLVPLGSFGMYSFLRAINVDKLSSFVGGLLFGFSGTSLAGVNDINSLQGTILIPWVLLAIQLIITQINSADKDLTSEFIKKLRMPILLFLFVASLQFISGHPQYSYYTWLVSGLYYWIFTWRKWKRSLPVFLVSFSLFFGLISIQLLPFLELSSQTYRPVNIEQTGGLPLQIWDLPRLIVGQFYGSWQRGNSWGFRAAMEVGRADTQGFIGLIGLFLSLIGGVTNRSRYTIFFVLLGVVTLILSFGTALPFYQLAQEFLPLFGKFRSPERILIIYTFALSALASMGLSYVRSKHIHAR